MKYHAIAYALVALLVCIAFAVMSGSRAPTWSTAEHFKSDTYPMRWTSIVDQYPGLMGVSIMDYAELKASKAPTFSKKNVASLMNAIAYASIVGGTIVAGTWDLKTKELSLWNCDECNTDYKVRSIPSSRYVTSAPTFRGSLANGGKIQSEFAVGLPKTSFTLVKDAARYGEVRKV